MLNLDFAYFNLTDKEKKGLFSRGFWLEKLTPILFGPRLESLINLMEIGAKGCNIKVPLGINNFHALNDHIRGNLIEKSLNIINDYNIDYMAVDRNLKPYFQDTSHNLIFGDNFIKALANASTAKIISQHQIEKIIIVGETEYFTDFLEVLAGYGLPLSMQNSQPEQYEILSHRLLYESGCAVSNSQIAPQNWALRDMVLYFAPELGQLTILVPELYYLEFTNNKVNLIPEMEASLQRSGVSLGINSLAPILETCLWNKEGFFEINGEQKETSEILNGRSFLTLQEVGDDLGIWDLFLDNGI